MLLLSGHEPDSVWHHFVDSATSLSIDLGAHTMVGLGAYPFAMPDTWRSPPCQRGGGGGGLGYLKNSVDVPAGVQAAVEHGFAARGVPAVGLWAQVPHYVSAAAYPPASVALLGGLGEVAGLRVDATVLRTESERHRSRLDELIASNPEHVEVLRQLEQAYDEEDQTAAAAGPLPFTAGDLPSGDELAAELERFRGTRAAEGQTPAAATAGGVRPWVNQYGQVSPSWPSMRATDPRRTSSNALITTLRANQPSSTACRPALASRSAPSRSSRR